MKYTYTPTGTCSRLISFEIDGDGLIRGIEFTGGCNGNLKGLSAMAEGMRPADVIERLRGIRCGSKSTSCPDQLAAALAQAL